MSFFDDASLAFLPSGAAGKDGKAYSIKPTDGTGDFTFSRGSNLSATRIGSDGLIEKGRENLLLQSNNFDTTWGAINANVTSGQSGYDGSSDAWELDATTAGGRLYQSVSFSGVHTFSIYAKKGTANGVRLRLQQTAVANAYVDLRDGSLFGSDNAIDVDIQDVSNGWYRITFALNASSVSLILIYPTDGATSQVSGSILLQDAQLEIGLAATDVISSGATTGKAGLLEDEPRFDYSGGATCPSLLLEPSRTNLLDYSEYFGDSYWTKSGTSVVSGFTSPEGLSNAYKLVEDSNNSTHFINSSGIVTPDTTYSSSVYIKPNDRNKVALRENSITGHYASFDLSDGTLIETTGVSASIESVSNGWYRIDYQVTSGPSYILGIYLLSDSYTSGDPYSNPYQGDGTSGAYIWGAQTESGSYPTSYIPNHSGGTITRGADSCSVTGVSSLIGQTEGTMYVDAILTDVIDTSNIRGVIGINDGGTNNRISIYRGANDSNLYAVVFANSTNQASFVSYNTTGNVKMALAYNSTEIVFYVNGSLVGSVASAAVPLCSDVDLGRITNRADRTFSDGINQALIFNERLSNADLETLTTL